MKSDTLLLIIAVLLVLLDVTGRWVHAQAEQYAQWVNVACYTNTCVASTLGTLTRERAADAKLTTWEDTTYVWYRK